MAHNIDTFQRRHFHRSSVGIRRRIARAPAAARQCRHYDRHAELARVLPLWPHELDDQTPQGRMRVLAKLRSALRAERRRGVAGHWTYDLARHAELLRVYRLELAACVHMHGAGIKPPSAR